MGLISTRIYGLLLASLLLMSLITIMEPSYGQQTEYVDRNALAWNLFYKLMTVAFIVGAIVQGTIVFIIFRFREKKVKSEETSR